jgi:aminoglycoside/choline kinase family phosphotransferase
MIGADGELRIIDHQDARIGSAAYDLVSLLLDRVTELPSPEWLTEKRRLFLDERERIGLERIDEREFASEFRLQTIQRCLKAIGTFSNQAANRGKQEYVQYIRPMFGIVLRALENLEKYPAMNKIIREQV